MESTFETLIAKRIAFHVLDHWNRNRTPIALSAVGVLLSNEALSTKFLFQQGGFLQFVERIAPDHGIEFIRDDIKKERIFLFPKGVQVDRDTVLDAANTSRKPSYPAGLWNAFIDRIEPATRRYVTIPAGETYVDIRNGETVASGLVEIAQGFLNEPHRFIAPDEIHDKIANWMKTNVISVEQVTGKAVSIALPEPTPGNALLNLLAQLTDDQRKSLQLRGDIVFQFMR